MLLANSALLLGLTAYVSAIAIEDNTGALPAQRSAAGTDDWPIGTQTGDVTFNNFGVGACGVAEEDGDYAVAISYLIFDNYPGYNGDPTSNPVCLQQLSINYQGKSVTVTVTDRCPSCSPTDLSVTPAAFEQLGDLSLGRLHDATWQWV